MKKVFLAITIIAILAILTVACNKSQTPVEIVSTNALQHGHIRAANSCNRDLIVNPNNHTSTCPLPGKCCWKDKKGGKHYCDCERAMSPLGGLLNNFTNPDGSVRTIEYFNTQDYSILFPDVDETIHSQIMNGSLKLYLMPWTDQTPADEGDLPLEVICQHIFALSSANTIANVNKTNIELIWVY